MRQYIKYLLLWLPLWSWGQVPISLEEAYSKAFQNNLDIKSGKLRIDYQEKMKRSYVAIDPLNVSAEVGQINSAYVDNRISVMQTLRLPKFYNAQKLVLEHEWQNAQLGLEVQKWQLKRDIQMIYNQLNYIDEKQKLLKKGDSIYSRYYHIAELRLKKGESNILEKTTAEAYRSQMQIQLYNATQDKAVLLQQFNFLLNDEEQQYVNIPSNFYTSSFDYDAQFSGNPLVLEQLDHQKTIENARLEAEKSKLLPSFSIGINSMSMKGTGADNIHYNGTHRFQSGVVGVAIPIFNAAQKSVIEGQKVNQQIAENNYNQAVKNFKNQYATAYSEYLKLKSEIEYYQSKGLKNAETILFTAQLLLQEGETNYLEYTTLINQALDIQNRYLDAQKMLNEKVIELNHLSANN